MKKARFGFILAAGGLAAFASGTSHAARPEGLGDQIAAQPFISASAYTNLDGNGNPAMNQDGGSAEQASITKFVGADGKTYVMTVGMTSNVPSNLMYWQCFCSSYVMEEDGPRPLATEVLITDNTGGERNCNHPAVAGMGLRNTFNGVESPGVAAVIYGSDIADPNNTTAPYATLVDTQCRRVMTPITDLMISNEGNDNAGPNAVAHGAIPSAINPDEIESFKVTTSTYENNGGGVAWAYGLTVSLGASNEPLIGVNWGTAVYTEVDIARMSVQAISNDRIAYFGPYGNTRPPNMGVVGHLLDANTGERLTDQNDPFYVDMADEVAREYYNSPETGMGPYENTIMACTTLSDGRGDGADDEKGVSVRGCKYLEITDNNEFTVQQVLPHGDIDMPFQTHSAICTGYDGAPNVDTMSFAMIGASPTNTGTGLMSIFEFGSTSIRPRDPPIDRQEIPLVENSDSMYQSNMYGGNPGDQGRNFQYCLGDIPNPAYAPGDPDAEGFMPWVKSFWAVSMSAKDPNYDKNGQYLVFVPATGEFDGGGCDPAVEDCDPCVEDPNSAECQEQQNPGGGPGAGNEAASGCACRAAGSSDSNYGAAGLLLVGLGIAAASRRRREEV